MRTDWSTHVVWSIVILVLIVLIVLSWRRKEPPRPHTFAAEDVSGVDRQPVCTVCGLYGIYLTHDCPGRAVNAYEKELIAKDQLDYIVGEGWLFVDDYYSHDSRGRSRLYRD